ncbi:MAG: hypothetical protein ACNA8W_19835, partial [Bradymonadaceae bacterium]
WRLGRKLERVAAVAGEATTPKGLDAEFETIFLGAALPIVPRTFLTHLRNPDGRLATFAGPRFRPQDLVCLTRRGDDWAERTLGRYQAPIVAGPNGWLTEPRKAEAIS